MEWNGTRNPSPGIAWIESIHLALVPNREDDHFLRGVEKSVLGDISRLSAKDQELAPVGLDRAADEWVAREDP